MRPVPAILLALAAVPALAQDLPKEAPGAPDPARVVAGTYEVDPGHTQVLFTVNHLGFSPYAGMFVEPTGTMVLDPADPAAARLDIRFPIAKVRTTVAALDEHLQKADFFDAARFPEGRFVATKVTATGTAARIEGDLTLKGVTRPITLDARFVGAGSAVMGPPKVNVGFAATSVIRRSDFGIDAAIPLVSDEVALTINAAFVRL